MTPSPSPADNSPPPARQAATGWQRFKAETIRLFHQYANWLVSISWKRFFVLSVLLLIAAVLLKSLPPFNYPIGSVADRSHPVAGVRPVPPVPPVPPLPRDPTGKSDSKDAKDRDVVISI